MRALTDRGASVGCGAALASKHALPALAVLAAVTLALLFAYREALASMVRLWNNSPMYSYGFTVPLVSAYLLWSRRNALGALTPRPSWAIGSVVLLAGVLMTIAGRIGGIQVLEQLAFLVSLAAAVLILFGVAYLRVGWASLAYLLLMVPLWDGFTEALHEPFQQRSAAIGVWLLHVTGIPAFRDGTFITLPNLEIEVARVCSGVNYLVAVVALGLPLGYVFLRDNWRRLVLLAVAVLVAALSNGLRVALICTLAYYEVGSPLHGPFHVLHGLFVAGVGYVVLFAGLQVLAPKNDREPASLESASAPAPAQSGARGRFVPIPASAVLILVFLLTGSNVLARPSRPVPLDGGVDALPAQLGEWTADPLGRTRREGAPTEWPGADVEIAGRYRRADGAVVDVYLGYFASQVQSRELVTHRSTEVHSRAVLTRVGTDGNRAFDANYLAPDRQGVSRMFWYDVDAQPETNRYLVKARTLWNAVRGARSNGAVIVLSTHTPGGSTPDRALGDIAGFVQEALAAHLPGGRVARN
jgi:EpsI family protein